MSSLEKDIPPVGEELRLPEPSVVPVLTAIGVTLALVGVTTYIELTIAGGLLTLGCVVRWIKDARHELDELPLD